MNSSESAENEAEQPDDGSEEGKMLVISKKSIGTFNFDDGIYLKFANSKPQHLQFYCKTLSQDTESCNVRLYKAASKEAITN